MKSPTFLLLAIASLFASQPFAFAGEPRKAALDAAVPYGKDGFIVRQEFWSGSVATAQPTVIRHQLYRGNSYWFWVGTEDAKATPSIHIYDADGKLGDAETWQKGAAAGVLVKPKKSGTYYIVIAVEDSPKPRTRWSLAYGYK
jgi:hypothetical protein